MATTERGTDLGKDEVFDLLSSHRRRYALHYCKDTEGEVTTSDVAETVAAWELEKEVEELNSAERKRVYTSLQQTHLPTLAEAGMITYENHEVELTDQARELEVYMDIVPGGSIPWGPYYLGLSGLAALLLAGLWTGLLPAGALPAAGWATLVLVPFAVSAAVQTYKTRKHRLGGAGPPS